jgi:hypothetical protein
MPAFIKTSEFLILQFPGRTARVKLGTDAAERVIQLLQQDASDSDILDVVDIAQGIRKHTSGIFSISDSGEVFIGPDRIPTVLSTRLVELANLGLLKKAQAIVNFWNNAKLNPNHRARTDLFAFLEHNGIPLTDDGCFVAYRAVTRNEAGDLVDTHTGTMINNVGSVVTMDREKVDPDPKKTCSTGLHAAAFEYAKGFNKILLEVKIDPKDVVAIPDDYNGQKMRVCRFEVLAINSESDEGKHLIDRPIYDSNDFDDEDDLNDFDDDSNDVECDFDDEDLFDNDAEDDSNNEDLSNEPDAYVNTRQNHLRQKRDANGRFIPKNQ